MTARYCPPELLDNHHELDDFSCRSIEQTNWLRLYGRQSSNSGTTKVFVVTEHDSPEVVAYYAWSMAQLSTVAAPARLLKGAGRYPQPMALLARLGVDVRHEGQGLGAALLGDVFRRLVAISDDIGCRGLVVHAESAEARDFYLHIISDFEESSTDPLHLVLLLKDLRKSV